MPDRNLSSKVPLLASLFVRIGFYVSHAEDTDVEEKSEDAEYANMRKAIKRIEARAQHDFISQAASEALSLKSPELPDTEESLSDDIKKLVGFLKDEKLLGELEETRKALMFVGVSVARAYREEIDHHEDAYLMQGLMDIVSGLLNTAFKPRDYKDINISPAEDSALTLISEALK